MPEFAVVERDELGRVFSDNHDENQVLVEAHDRLGRSITAETDNRTQAEEDVRFRNDDQWPSQVKEARVEEQRPCLTLNKLNQYIDKVVGDQRQNRPAIKVRSIGKKSPTTKLSNAENTKNYDVAQVLDGLIRHIENTSQADIAKDTAFDHAVGNGFGYFRVTTDYVDDDVFEQKLSVRRIPNPFSVYFDPSAQELTREDAQYAFLTSFVAKEEYQRRWPNAGGGGDISAGVGDWVNNWFKGDDVRVAEYFRKVPTQKVLVSLSDGRVVEHDTDFDMVKDELAAMGVTPVRTRKVKTHKIQWMLLSGYEMLEGPIDWPGKYIPIIPVLGKELWSEGQLYYRSLIRHSKDAQRMYNYWRTASVELVALAPKVPYIVADDQVQNYLNIWKTANTKSHAYLPYNARSKANPPKRERLPEIPTGAVNEALTANDDIKGTIGMYDASIGARSNEVSGKAINAREKQGDTMSYPFMDNLMTAVEYEGRILIDLIPKIYDTERMIRILNPDGEEDEVLINQTVVDEDTGKPVDINDITLGKYDIVAKVGPSFATQRIEAVESMTAFAQAVPDLAVIMSDLMAGNMDWPGADQIAERFKRYLEKTHPGITDDRDEEEREPTPEEQMQMQLQQEEMEVQKLEREARTAEAEAAIAESKSKMASSEIGVREASAKARQAEAGARKSESMTEDKVRELVAKGLAELAQEMRGEA